MVVTLVSTAPHDEVVRYLVAAGFDVRALRTPVGAQREGTLVWLTEPGFDEHAIVERLRVWLGAKASLRAVVVTDRPARLKEASDDTRGRVLLLAAPVFGWQLVDALRDDARGAR